MSDRIAVVTGAGAGIGKAIAERLWDEGCHVALIDKDAEACSAVAATLSGRTRALSIAADVTDSEAVGKAMDAVVSALGAPSILVNNAGFARDVPFDRMTIEQWDDVQDVHLRGSFLMARSLVPHMKDRGWGRIINISSISAWGHAERANYCAAKAGMHGFIRSLAVELGPFGITANAVAPGFVLTAMTEATAARRGLSLEDHLENVASRIPVRRIGRPEDIADAVAYFAREKAGFVTGQVLTVSGGVIV